MPSADPWNLPRFLEAQRDTFATALAELQAGRKRTHWMWFIFPQIAGLGHSAMAQKYAIQSLDEAAAYLRHPVLGARLLECAQALLQVEGRSATEIMGNPDDLKLRSSMTLFSAIAGADRRFADVLEKYYGGAADPRTLEILGPR